jgi:two-component system response regulator QseB
VQIALKQEGYAADWVQDGAAADLALLNGVYDLLLLDLGLPRKSGLSILRGLRARGDDLQVLILTARDDVPDRIEGLDSGADDYLVKPFDLSELCARIRALSRRRSGRAGPVIERSGLRVDPATHDVQVDGHRVSLSAREFSLLSALLEQPGVPLSRAQLEDRVYGWGEEIESNAVEVHIHSLRRKLGAERIRNVRGVGYLIP